ncbi:hypothetical protein [Pseudomonas poae]|uniref:Uncharacterized protein n=1 Tax=Pseudomonas poae TaxID=200451 RepID=A0A2S9E3I5_9PSED|nr:hypothetical protein [Pseudomonas poae]PRC09419.1 hypothetical protein CQZ99_27765 [Pseudomonas poae]
MKIRVSEVLSVANTIRVHFHSSAGSGTALWMGTPPGIGEEHDVEFDLNEVFSWGKNLIPSYHKAPHITVINGVTQITAQIVQNADEEWAALQLGDSIILIELDGTLPQESRFVEVKATNIHLYPTNI